MTADSKYANTGLSLAEMASLDACDAAHAKWWKSEKKLGWCEGINPFALRIAFNSGWYFCSQQARQGDAHD